MATLDPLDRAMLFTPEFEWPARGRFRKALRQFGCSVLDLVYPPHCASCGEALQTSIESIVCESCADEVRWIDADRCVRCGDMVGTGSGPVEACVSCQRTPPRFVKACACVLRYEKENAGPARDIVLGLKFGGRGYEAKMMGRLLARRVKQTQLLDGFSHPLVVPAPMTRWTMFRRGYNQAAELAWWVARELKLKQVPELLVKTRSTLPQALLSEKRRRTNLSGAFECPARAARRFKSSDILLIDDVITTGSTISECARTLDAAGMGRIVAASFARG